MTIKEAAQFYGITQQAIYSRLKTTGIALDTIRNPDTGEITSDGEAVFKKLFDKSERPEKESSKQLIERLQAEVNSARVANNILLERIKLLEKRIEELESDKRNLTDLARGTQAALTQALALLPAPADKATEANTEPRRGLFGKLFKR